MLVRTDTKRAASLAGFLAHTEAPPEDAVQQLRALPGAPKCLRRAAKPMSDSESAYPQNRARAMLLAAAGDGPLPPSHLSPTEQKVDALWEMTADDAFATLATQFPQVAALEQEARAHVATGDWPLPETRRSVAPEHRGILWLGVNLRKHVGPGSEASDPVLRSHVAGAVVGGRLTEVVWTGPSRHAPADKTMRERHLGWLRDRLADGGDAA